MYFLHKSEYLQDNQEELNEEYEKDKASLNKKNQSKGNEEKTKEEIYAAMRDQHIEMEKLRE